MIPTPSLVDASGRPIRIEKLLAAGEGGEGRVYSLQGDNSQVVKFYYKQAPDREKCEKLATMLRISTPELLKISAWPTGLVYDSRTRQVAGFTMPRMHNAKPIQQLYSPGQRVNHFQAATWAFQARVAHNLSAAFVQIHKAGHLVCDMNENNAFVTPDALVRIIDCDSFQISASGKHFLCEVGKAEFTPPELQSQSFRGLVRTINHDVFGLAVLIYHLLFAGRHPYNGRLLAPDPDSLKLPDFIRTFRPAQGPLAKTWGMAPPPWIPTYDDIPAEVATLFRRAFERGSELGTRPRASEWVTAIDRMEREIVQCPADPGHQYWRGQSRCIWCRLEQNNGPQYYFGAGNRGNVEFTIDQAKLQEVIRRLNSISRVDFPYDRNDYLPSKKPEPSPLPEHLEGRNQSTLALFGVAAVFMLISPIGCLLHWLLMFGVATASLVFLVWGIIHVATSPERRHVSRLNRAYQDAKATMNKLEDRWEYVLKRYRKDFDATVKRTQQLIQRWQGLLNAHQEALRVESIQAERSAFSRHMRLNFIADATIPGIGSGRKQKLDAYGIRTAEDVNENRIKNIDGFGPTFTKRIVEWRDSVANQFRFDPQHALSSAQLLQIATKFRETEKRIHKDIVSELTELAKFGPECRIAIENLKVELHEAVSEWEQAKIDLRHFQKHHRSLLDWLISSDSETA